jgi:hypothetical protein
MGIAVLSPLLFTAADVVSALGYTPANTAGDTFTSTVNINSGIVSASTPLLNMTQTWNNAGINFTAIKLAVSNSASGANSLFVDLWRDGASQFSIDRNGSVTSNNNGTFAGSISAGSGSAIYFTTRGVLRSTADATFSFRNSAETVDARLVVENNHVLTQRNGTNAQSLFLYSTYTDGSNLRRSEWYFDANGAHLVTNAIGTGVGTAEALFIGPNGNANLNFQTNNTTAWSVLGSGGHFTPATTATYDLGSSTKRIRNTYLSNNIDQAIGAPTVVSSANIINGSVVKHLITGTDAVLVGFEGTGIAMGPIAGRGLAYISGLATSGNKDDPAFSVWLGSSTFTEKFRVYGALNTSFTNFAVNGMTILGGTSLGVQALGINGGGIRMNFVGAAAAQLLP